MDVAAKSTSPLFQEIGTVRSVVGEKLTVATPSGEFTARRAASCMLQPKLGDQVLLVVPPEGDLYALAVLERADQDVPAELRVEGDLELKATGELRVTGVDGVQLRSPSYIELGSRQIGVTAVETRLKSDKLHVLGRFVQANAETVKTVLGTMDTFLDRFSQHVKRSYRFVEEMDVTRAEQIDTRANKTLTMRAENAFVTADELVKVDGEQIHLG